MFDSNSDDFNLPYENRHPDYIQTNIYESILTSHLSLIPDFDMFASNPRDHWPTYHALLRCLSPGPLLLSDTPDTETDKALLVKMTAKTRSGRLKAVKTDSPAQALPGRWFWDNLQGEQDGPATLAYVKVPSAQGTIIGAWSCRRTGTSSVARDRIFLQDLEDALEVDQLDGEYALWSVGHSGRNGRRVELFRPGSPAEMPLELEKAECEAIIIAKVWEVKGQKVAVVGMLDKFAPLARLQVSVQGGEQSLSRSAASSDSAPDELKIRTEFASDQLSVLVFGDSKPSASFMVDGNAVASAPWIESVRGAWLLSVTVGVEGQMTSGEGAWEVQLVLG